MKRTSVLAVAGVLAVAACQDQPTQPKVIAPSRTQRGIKFLRQRRIPFVDAAVSRQHGKGFPDTG